MTRNRVVGALLVLAAALFGAGCENTGTKTGPTPTKPPAVMVMVEVGYNPTHNLPPVRNKVICYRSLSSPFSFDKEMEPNDDPQFHAVLELEKGESYYCHGTDWALLSTTDPLAHIVCRDFFFRQGDEPWLPATTVMTIAGCKVTYTPH